jgi:hypothetical protein
MGKSVIVSPHWLVVASRRPVEATIGRRRLRCAHSQALSNQQQIATPG